MEVEENKVILGGFMWAPSQPYWKDILNVISQNYEIIKVKKYKFHTFDDLANSILRLYKHDNVNLNKIIDNKIELLKHYEPVCLNFYFKVNKKEFKESKHGKKSIAVITMKHDIREKYKSKIHNYTRDVIIHISDNAEQTEFVYSLLNKYIKAI